jgi:hypothetical protein
MKVKFEFEDLDEAMTAMKGSDWKSVVFNLDQYLRNTIKHSDKEETVRQEIRDRLHELLSNYNLILE